MMIVLLIFFNRRDRLSKIIIKQREHYEINMIDLKRKKDKTNNSIYRDKSYSLEGGPDYYSAAADCAHII